VGTSTSAPTRPLTVYAIGEGIIPALRTTPKAATAGRYLPAGRGGGGSDLSSSSEAERTAILAGIRSTRETSLIVVDGDQLRAATSAPLPDLLHCVATTA